VKKLFPSKGGEVGGGGRGKKLGKTREVLAKGEQGQEQGRNSKLFLVWERPNQAVRLMWPCWSSPKTNRGRKEKYKEKSTRKTKRGN